MNQLTSDAA